MAKDRRSPGNLEFDQLFLRYYAPVTYYFVRRGFSKDQSEELAQDTFMSAYKGWQGYRREASINTWLYTIAGNIYRNELRRLSAEKRHGHEESLESTNESGQDKPSFTELPDPCTNDDPYTQTLIQERCEMLGEALKGLPPRMHHCFLLRYEQELKYREIADLMQISIQTVKSTISQARQHLKKKMGDP